jgi:hypothetical protein
VIYLHGFTGSFMVQAWLVGEATRKLSILTVAVLTTATFWEFSARVLATLGAGGKDVQVWAIESRLYSPERRLVRWSEHLSSRPRAPTPTFA